MDSGRVATGTFEPDSGLLLKTIGADGTQFELSVPVEALASAATISMRPIANVSSNPIGTATIVGVDLEPAGLGLMASAELRITPPSRVPPTVGFGFSAGGAQFHLRTMNTQSGVTTVRVTRMMGAGIGTWSTTVARAAAPGFQPTGSDGMSQRLALYALGETSDLASREAAFSAYWNETVKPLLQAPATPRIGRGNSIAAAVGVSTPCQAAVVALREYAIAIEIYRALNPTAAPGSLGGTRERDALRTLVVLYKACADDYGQQCVSNHKLPYLYELQALADQVRRISARIQDIVVMLAEDDLLAARNRCRNAKISWVFQYKESGLLDESAPDSATNPKVELISGLSGETTTSLLALYRRGQTNRRLNPDGATYTAANRFELGFGAARSPAAVNTGGSAWPFAVPLTYTALSLSDGKCVITITPGAIAQSQFNYAETEWELVRDVQSNTMLDATRIAVTISASPGNDPGTVATKAGCTQAGPFPFANTFAPIYFTSALLNDVTERTAQGRLLPFKKRFTAPAAGSVIAAFYGQFISESPAVFRGLINKPLAYLERIPITHLPATP